ncbi:MAG: PAS domain S-box protein, partial [Phycisphaerales bacterium]
MPGSRSISRIVGTGCTQPHATLVLVACEERSGRARHAPTPTRGVAALGVLGCAASALAAALPDSGQPSQAGPLTLSLLLFTTIGFAGACVALFRQLGRARRASAAASAGASEARRRLSNELSATHARLAAMRELSFLPSAEARGPEMADLGNRLPRLLEAALPGCDAGLCREGELPPQGVSVAIQQFDCERELMGSAWVRRRDGQPPEPHERETLAELVRAFVGVCDAIRHDQRRERLIGTLRDLESQSRRLFESIPVPMWVYSTDTLAILRVNQAAVERYGFSREEWAGMSMEDIRPPEDIPKMRRIIAEVRDTNLDSYRTTRHRAKSGEILWVEIASRPAPFVAPDARLVLCQDVTSREMDLRSLARQTTELSKTNEELDRFATIA